MIYKIYCYRDVKVGFGQPIIDFSEESAIRGFSFAVNNKEGIMNFSPADFELYRIGEFDSSKGIIKSEPVPVHIVSGASVISEKGYV